MLPQAPEPTGTMCAVIKENFGYRRRRRPLTSARLRGITERLERHLAGDASPAAKKFTRSNTIPLIDEVERLQFVSSMQTGHIDALTRAVHDAHARISALTVENREFKEDIDILEARIRETEAQPIWAPLFKRVVKGRLARLRIGIDAWRPLRRKSAHPPTPAGRSSTSPEGATR
jgi:hypothetical protein